MRGHGFADPLAEPGLADLTAHVNFPAAHIAETAGLTAAPITRKGCLEALGLSLRSQQLIQLSPEREADIESERHRLAAPQKWQPVQSIGRRPCRYAAIGRFLVGGPMIEPLTHTALAARRMAFSRGKAAYRPAYKA